MKQLRQDIKDHEFKNAYLMYGEEEYLKSQYLSDLINALVGENAQMNCDTFDEKTKIGSIIDACETLPFMCERRLVIVKDAGLFSAKRSADGEVITKYMETLPSSVCLVFVEDAIDKRLKSFKQFSKCGYAAEFKTPPEKDIVEWIVKLFKKQKKAISSLDAVYLARISLCNMYVISNEMQKLISYKNDTQITRQDIDDICHINLEARIFELVGALCARKPSDALKQYSNILNAKESPLMVLSMISRQYRLILQSKLLLEGGATQDYIAQQTGQRPYPAGESIRQSKSFSVDELQKSLQTCLKTETDIKTGIMPVDMAVELLIAELCVKS